jgi:hypothetical protein
MISRAFVLGNGRSRLNVDLNKLKEHGKVYGCNALYREFSPDVLIAVDPKMIVEICQNGYQMQNQVWTNPNNRFSNFQRLNFFRNPRGWSSGPTALYKACLDVADEIYILGFDYHGNNNGLLNNIYADTDNYRKSSDQATYHGNWLKQTEHVIREFPNTFFYRVIDKNTKLIEEWRGLTNFRHIDYDALKNISN